MPPLLNQPNWHPTDKSEPSLPPLQDSASAKASVEVTSAAETVLPSRTRPSATVEFDILITDDNAINRRVSFTAQ